jgi:hypothetical protein
MWVGFYGCPHADAKAGSSTFEQVRVGPVQPQ